METFLGAILIAAWAASCCEGLSGLPIVPSGPALDPVVGPTLYYVTHLVLCLKMFAGGYGAGRASNFCRTTEA
jgi:hypothetical protein